MPLSSNIRQRLEAARNALETRLAAAECQGFSELAENVRLAVLASERLVLVLEDAAALGFRPRDAEGEPVPVQNVIESVQALRAAVGDLALTTPRMFSSHYADYSARARSLLDSAWKVRRHGVEQLPSRSDEWDPFRQGSVTSKTSSSTRRSSRAASQPPRSKA